jgi:hypothetical protein
MVMIQAVIISSAAPQRGFAWTNGLFTALLARIILGIEPVQNSAETKLIPNFPSEWAGEEVRIYPPDYPWREGVR